MTVCQRLAASPCHCSLLATACCSTVTFVLVSDIWPLMFFKSDAQLAMAPGLTEGKASADDISGRLVLVPRDEPR